jgi:hypothetical protein
MKATLKFNLPGDEFMFKQAINGPDMAVALYEINEYLRGVDKYDTGDKIDEIRERFFGILENNNINLDNIIE